MKTTPWCLKLLFLGTAGTLCQCPGKIYGLVQYTTVLLEELTNLWGRQFLWLYIQGYPIENIPLPRVHLSANVQSENCNFFPPSATFLFALLANLTPPDGFTNIIFLFAHKILTERSQVQSDLQKHAHNLVLKGKCSENVIPIFK